VANTKEIKLLILLGVFLGTCVFVYGRNESRPATQKPPIRQFLAQVAGYDTERQIELAADAYKMLALDDYAYTDYRQKDKLANLYIGYYYSADKAYASHSPTVCFPSQGWTIDRQPTTHTLTVGPHRIVYEEIITSRGDERELVLYWYQSRLLTNTKIYKNKIAMGYNKFSHNDEQHAFVRVALPLAATSTYAATKEDAINFIKAFYPKFVDFIVCAGQEQPTPL